MPHGRRRGNLCPLPALTGSHKPLTLRDRRALATPPPARTPHPRGGRPMPWRLSVVDGGDRGQSYPLPAAGTIRIGNYGGHTDICLHDLYVAKDHCHVEVGEGMITVIAQPSAAGTLVNGTKIVRQEVKAGDILRV